MKRLLLACVAALVVAVPTASATTFKLRAGGYVRTAGTTGDRALFSVDFKAGPGHKVVFKDAYQGLYFRSLGLTNVQLIRNAVKITGWGLVNGSRVHFQAIAVDHPAAVDIFKISWSHHASLGGNVLGGNIRILPVAD